MLPSTTDSIQVLVDKIVERGTCIVPALYGIWERRMAEKKQDKEIKAEMLQEMRNCKGRLCPICGHCQAHCLRHKLRNVVRPEGAL